MMMNNHFGNLEKKWFHLEKLSSWLTEFFPFKLSFSSWKSEEYPNELSLSMRDILSHMKV